MHTKVLINLGGKPVIQHVYERVVAANVFNEVLIVVVKAVIDLQGNGMYFSRSLIPAPHNNNELSGFSTDTTRQTSFLATWCSR